MSQTSQLIDTLARDPVAVPKAGRRVALALLVGGLIALAGLMLMLGSPIGPIAERGLAASAIKFSYPLLVCVVAAFAGLAAGRPGVPLAPRMAWLALPLLFISILAATDLSRAPQALWNDMLFGSTFFFCLAAVTLGSLPATAGLVWAFGALAPVRPRLAGFIIGLGAGAASAAAYALYCPEGSPAFLLATYTLAMLIPAALAASAGRILTRW